MIRGGSRTAAIFKMEHFVIIVNGWKPLITRERPYVSEFYLHNCLMSNTR